ncbi:MAG: hypothetical protein V9F00_17900 [Nocardioides sp.]
MPKAAPGASRDADTHDRVRHDRVDKSGNVTLRVNGQLHHIGIGRTHDRTHVILLIHDLDVTQSSTPPPANSSANSTIDPAKDYQPQK